ncbi:MAG: glycosyltransferase family 2 protein [Candidatus Omnitrophica bacterium]|nr:glycosyltransferase family 2 protein [Candidatus Omnitrophota bacterium]
MKLIIQIPCHNEEKTLPLTLQHLPKKISGIDSIEVLVIDDGSTDNTVAVAKQEGVAHILSLAHRSGLAKVFSRGLEESLRLGADIIVNTDGDNQYPGDSIPELVEPIIKQRAAMVIGCRDIKAIAHFSFSKKILQSFGSSIVRKFSATDIPDTTSGFRAYSRDAAMRLNIHSTYTYTLETIIQAGRQNMLIKWITVKANEKLRESRLIKSIPSYIMRSVATIFRIYLMYEPLRTFLKMGAVFFFLGFALIVRFFYFYFTQGRSGHVQSLIIAAIFVLLGIGTSLLGFVGDLISANRRLNEEVLYRLKKREFSNSPV